MHNRTKPALVGLFVLGGLALAFAGLLAFGGLRWFEPSQEVVVYFGEPLGGLSAGAPVTFRGIEIGSVRKIAIKRDPETNRVLMPVYMTLRPNDVDFAGSAGGSDSQRIDVERLVAQGLRAQLRPRSLLTGQMGVDLDFHPDDPVKFRHSADEVTEIPAKRSDVQRARDAIEQFPWKDTLESVVRTLDSLESVSQTLETEFTGLGDEIRVTLSDSRELIHQSRRSVDALETRAMDAMGSLEGLGDEGRTQLRARGDELEQVLQEAAGTLERTDAVVSGLEDLTHPRSPERDDLRRLLRELSSASTAMRRFAEKVEQRPNALLFDGGEEDRP